MSSLRTYYDAFRRTLPPRDRFLFWAAKSWQFGGWQVLLQSIQLVTGFLFVRWLSYETYAQYGLTQGFQSMLAQLVDLGFSGSIIALVGQRVGDREVVGRYMKAAWRQRTVMLLLVVPIAAPVFYWLARSHAWPMWSSFLLFLSVTGLLLSQGWVSVYSPALMMHQKLSEFYRPQVGLNAARLLTCSGLHAISALGAVAICWINALVAFGTGVLYRSASRPYAALPPHSDRDAELEMRKYLAPLVAGMVFYAFHGQVQVFLISIFGTSRSIAEVSALGRVGHLFVFLSSFITTMLVPFIARVPPDRIALRYTQTIGVIVVIAIGMSALAFAYPGVLLVLLGPKYAGLQAEVALSVTASALGMVTVALYSFNNARKWVFHMTAVTSIGGLVVIEALMIAMMDLSSTFNVMRFSVATAVYPILPFACAAIYGCRRARAAPGVGM